MFFRKEKNISKGIKKMDAIITGLILGGILASVYGIKKYEESKTKNEGNQIVKKESFFKKFIKKLIGKN